MKLSIRSTIAAVVLALVLVAGAVSAQYDYAGNKYVISAEELLGLLGSENVKIYDFQRYEDYTKAHIPGAMNFDTTLLITEERFAYEFDGVENAVDMFSAAGISNDDLVILYWGRDRSEATYAFWVLDYIGHENVRLLDGGFNAWQAAGFETVAGDEVYEPATLTPNVDPSRYASLEWVQENLVNPTFDFVDARGRAAYESAHLPALNDLQLESAAAFNANGLLKSPEELLATLNGAGLFSDREIVTYCTRGRLASQLYWVLKVAGYQNVRNFEASMSGWNAAGLPVASSN